MRGVIIERGVRHATAEASRPNVSDWHYVVQEIVAEPEAVNVGIETGRYIPIRDPHWHGCRPNLCLSQHRQRQPRRKITCEFSIHRITPESRTRGWHSLAAIFIPT